MSNISFLKYGVSRKSSLTFLKERQKSCVSSKIFLPNEEEMKRVFDKYDKNNDGKISREEYRLVVKAFGGGNAETKVSKAFEAIDTDGDGFIDFKEFMEVQKNGGGVKENDIRRAFCVFDLNGDGKISAEELLEVLRRLGEKCSLASCKKMVKGVDKDGDGVIDIDEFISMMTQTMKPLI